LPGNSQSTNSPEINSAILRALKPRKPGFEELVQLLLKPVTDSLLAEQLLKKELIMSRPLKVVALSGGTWRPSRTLVLTQALLAELAEQLPIESH
jgi:FMN reductase